MWDRLSTKYTHREQEATTAQISEQVQQATNALVLR